ncbi:MAG: hypothetical protein B7Y76_11580, partial [Sphingobacteriia bacterium 35-40-5]
MQTETAYKQQEVLVQQAQLAFIFPGQGAQFSRMGKGLYADEPVFKEAIDHCANILSNYMEVDIRNILYPIAEDPIVLEKIHLTQYAQPAIFIVEYALAKLCQSWGFEPNYFLGHSIGEYVAAHLAGVFSLEDALMLIANRGQLMSEMPNGSMLAVKTDKQTIVQHLPKDCSIAAINSPKSIVVAGPLESIHQLSATLSQLEIPNSILKTSHAFHSAMMEPMLDAFQAKLEKVQFYPPSMPIISTLTGEIVEASLLCQPQYWVKQIRSTVVFSDAVETLLNTGVGLAMEIGPGNVTSKLLMQQLQGKDCFCSGGLVAQDEKLERVTLLQNIGQLWIRGYEPNWNHIFDTHQRIHLDLPTYVFNRKRFWLDPIISKNISAQVDQPIPPTVAISNTTDLIEELSERDSLMQQLKDVLEQASGLELASANESLRLLELGFDSLLLTQVAI